MQCPKCGHRIPDKGDRCLYCGAWIKGEASSATITDSPAGLVSSGKMGKNFTGIQVPKEEINYKKLEELPLSLRAKVEEILKKGEGQNEGKKASYYNPPGIKTSTSFHKFPESMEGTGRKRKRMGFMAALRFLLKKE